MADLNDDSPGHALGSAHFGEERPPGRLRRSPSLMAAYLDVFFGRGLAMGRGHQGGAFFRFCLTFQRLQYAAENAFELFREASICSPSRFKAPGVRQRGNFVMKEG
ncbi:hypothetical protein N7499_003077 [Penicillium canescens]|uniref:Uncharacterized protein n=1 Tax=Penicillium canescens TaxID=5083 RepID=A0AAD6ID49_PENCN|nr:uncharacterized protein N7446_011950 [Penicillium canescens]XP_058368273.1 uncharacterized protein N7446_010692 [Penicillium canescens]KAJ6019820.1 hypothetical protein N7522_000528 [Penicillium canescens]KAJ6039115.1 hypothetical protein N7460_007147 [Penicillium canescens]KAJ6041418.1 hypothetical protein N7460_006808 [Penicillium canescens]KAJ6047116.1 hypothetical protein N7446_011950 [Penicillium canescens]KAJ6050583.1 hypothetical protein N7446_010692 [Penicillium canescens]